MAGRGVPIGWPEGVTLSGVWAGLPGWVLTAFALFAGQTWARIVAVILVILNAIGQLLLVPAQPWWSFILIAIDVLVVYALIVHGRELHEA